MAYKENKYEGSQGEQKRKNAGAPHADYKASLSLEISDALWRFLEKTMEQSNDELIMSGVEEYYKKENGKVYQYWRHVGTKRWNRRRTDLEEVPYKEISI